MASVTFTDKYIASLKPPSHGRLEIYDSKVPNLGLRVSESGRKTLFYRYRDIEGTHRRCTLGTYPSTRLADARDAAIRIAGQVSSGKNPARDLKNAREQAKRQVIKTFSDLANAYLKACEEGLWKPKGKKKKQRTLDDDRAVYKRYLTSTLGPMRLSEISSPVVRKILQDMIRRGINAQTNRTQAFIRQAYNFGKVEYSDIIQSNPADFPPLGEIHRRDRILSDDEIRVLWAALSDPAQVRSMVQDKGQRSLLPSKAMTIVLKLCLLLALRESEVAGMEVSELDLGNSGWTIRSERMKNNRKHFVPLPALSCQLINEAINLRSDTTSNFVFPSPKILNKKPISGGAVGHAMKRLVKAIGLNRVTPHDLRRTASTIMTQERVGVLPFIRSKVLGHTGDTGGGASVTSDYYDVNEYASEKRDALRRWEKTLSDICNLTA